jgi:tight adherence protein B
VQVMRHGVGEMSESLVRYRMLRRLGAALVQAGYHISLESFLTRSAALVFGLAGLGTLLTGALTSGVLLGLVTIFGIYFWVSRQRGKRLRQIDAQLPKALELMMFGLRAGHSLEDTIGFAARELTPPLAHELGRCHEEYELGRPIEDALMVLSARLEPCKALRTFVEAVMVLKQTGGNLIEVIEKIIEMLRAQAAFEARFRALTSEGRTSGMILGALPLIILCVVGLLQPAYLSTLVIDPAGWKVLAIAGVLWVTGILWMLRLLRIEV